MASPRRQCVGPRLSVLQAAWVPLARRAALIFERLQLPSVVALAPAHWEAASDPTLWTSRDVGRGHHPESLRGVLCFGLV